MLRTLVIAAHPDEPEIYAGGTAALLARAGHAVKFLTLTNGDAGHHELERGPLARRRAKEAWRAADALGVVDYEIFDVHDGMLEATVELRLRVLAQIRAWRPDVVIALHGDGGGHPDNRAAGQLAAHAVEFAMTRNLEVGKPALERMPLCLLMTDYASAPVHRADVAVDVSPVIEAKLDACLAHASQFLEFAPWQRGFLDQAPPAGDVAAGRAFVLEHWAEFLKEETFQLAGYGRKADAEEAARMIGVSASARTP
ncbi:MAG: PIG-L family deacetylase [Nonomuraea sp.]|nr:PIG-L family deacetylase [Nonomuraea sp.]NUP79061.1 PIG-L family deacetylase [Nonomuraea sp.]NUS01180.1 PIG-L family deacetylase [Nonomuraea sp.]